MRAGMTRRAFTRQAALAAAAGLVPRTGRAQRPAWTMKLATASVMFDTLSLEEVCRRTRRLNLQALDIWGPFTHYKTRCDHLLDAKQRLGGTGLRDLMRAHDLEVAAFTLYQEARLDDYWEMIRDYGGGIVVRGDRAAPSPPGEMTRSMRAFFEALKPEIERAEKAGAILAIENHSGGLLNSHDSFRAFVELNPRPDRVGIAFAPWHLQGYGEPSVEEFLKVAAPQLRFFYAWQRGTQRDKFGPGQLPGIGPADFTPWCRVLADADYRHSLSIFLHGHASPDETETLVAQSRDYLLACRDHLRVPAAPSE